MSDEDRMKLELQRLSQRYSGGPSCLELIGFFFALAVIVLLLTWPAELI